MHTRKINVLKVGHRGAPGYEPENTLRSFRRAIELGAGMIELDVHLCKSGEAVVIHDLTVDRTTNGTGKVASQTLEELKLLDAGKGETIPTLQEVINLVKKSCALNIEIKNRQTAKIAAELVCQNGIIDSTHITSSYIRPLKTIFKMQKGITTGLIHYAARTEFRQQLFYFFSLLLWPITYMLILRRAHAAQVRWVNLARVFATKRLIKTLHRLNYKVAVWIVNDQREIQKMRGRNVDAIISDFPDRLNFE
ncbi:MAG: glycerophosphodiester phosphodiesterase family protein [Patescibacteria group bacterium]